MNCVQHTWLAKRMPPLSPTLSPRHFSNPRGSPVRRLGNAIMHNNPVRSASQRGQQYAPSRTASTHIADTAAGSSSGRSSPDDAPLTVKVTQQRPERRRRIIESTDEEGDEVSSSADSWPGSATVSASPRRQLASPNFRPKAPANEQRALQNLTNLPDTDLLEMCPMGRPAAIVQLREAVTPHKGPGSKRGILELAALLSVENANGRFRPGVDGSQAAASTAASCTSSLAAHSGLSAAFVPLAFPGAHLQPSTSPASKPGGQECGFSAAVAGDMRPATFFAAAAAGPLPESLGSLHTNGAGDHDNDGSDEEEVPMTFARSIPARRTRQRTILSDSSDSDSADRPHSNAAAAAGPRYAQEAVGLADLLQRHSIPKAHQHDAEVARELQERSGGACVPAAHVCDSAGPGVQLHVADLADTKHSHRSSPSFHSACSDDEGTSFGSTQAAGISSERASRTSAAEPGRSLGLGLHGGAVPIALGQVEAPPALRDGPLAASLLYKVPRRRQGQRDARDAAGEAAVAALDGSCFANVNSVSAKAEPEAGSIKHTGATSEHSDGLMYDLYGELQLLTQLGGLSFAAGGDMSDSDLDHEGPPKDYTSGDVPPDLPSPSSLPKPAPPPRIGAAAHEVFDLTLCPRSSSSASISTIGTSVSSSGTRDNGNASSNLNAVAADPDGSNNTPCGLLDAYRQAQQNSLPATDSGIAAIGSRGDGGGVHAGPGVADMAQGDGGEKGQRAASEEGSDSDLKLQLAPLCKRPPPTMGRRRAVVLDSSSEEEGSDLPQQQQQRQPNLQRLFEDHSVGKGSKAVGDGDGRAEPTPPLPNNGARWHNVKAVETTGRHSGSTVSPFPRDCQKLLSSEDNNSSDGFGSFDKEDFVSKTDFFDCSLETPLPSLPTWNPTPPHVGGGGVTGSHKPSSQQQPQAVPSVPPLSSWSLFMETPSRPSGAVTNTPAGAALPTAPTGRKGQRWHNGDGMHGNAGQAAPAPQPTPAAGAGGMTDGGARKPRAKARAPGAVAEQRAFLAARAGMAQELYNKWNAEVFDGRLPADLPLVWNSRLTSTAGQVVGQPQLPGTNRRVPARLELSPRLIDNLDKLRNTLSHEICHVAAWHLSHEYDRPHGPAWEHWARCFTRHDPSLVIRRTHDYITSYAHRWRCTREGCGKEYGRQRQTIRVGVHVCSVCHAQLEYLGHFDKNGNLKACKAAAAGTPAGVGAAGAGVGLTPGTAAKPLNGYAQFCKDNFDSVRTTLPANTPSTVIFKQMGLLFKKHKANLAASAAAGGGPSPSLRAAGAGGPNPPDVAHPLASPRGGGPHGRESGGDGEERRRSGAAGSGPSATAATGSRPAVRKFGREGDELVPRFGGLSLDDG